MREEESNTDAGAQSEVPPARSPPQTNRDLTRARHLISASGTVLGNMAHLNGVALEVQVQGRVAVPGIHRP